MSTALASPVSNVIDCLKTLGLDGAIEAIDPDGLCLLEIDSIASVAGQPWASLWPAQSRDLVAASVRRAAGGKVARFSADCPTFRGTPKSWEVTVAPIRNAEGQVIALQALSQDVTRRERDREEKAIVSRELAHRIKNLFAVVDSLIHLSSRQEQASKPFVEGLRQRLRGLGRAIAYIHPMDPEDFESAPRTLQGLIVALMAPYELAGAHITVGGDDTPLGQQAVTSVAMVLNELATNAVKYGALREGDGQLSIHLTRGPDSIVVNWGERGALHAPSGMTAGFGAALLDRTVISQLAGSIDRRWSPGGLDVRLEFPLGRLAEQDGA